MSTIRPCQVKEVYCLYCIYITTNCSLLVNFAIEPRLQNAWLRDVENAMSNNSLRLLYSSPDTVVYPCTLRESSMQSILQTSEGEHSITRVTHLHRGGIVELLWGGNGRGTRSMGHVVYFVIRTWCSEYFKIC